MKAELEDFLKDNIFVLPGTQHICSLAVLDPSRKFIVALATTQDLDVEDAAWNDPGKPSEGVGGWA
jgi:hypothetical protein